MALNKREIQQMLREMNVKFDADASYAELKACLQQENHNLWLKSVKGQFAPECSNPRGLIRKRRRKNTLPPDPQAVSPIASVQSEASIKPIGSERRESIRRSDLASPAQRIDKPAPGKPWKAVAEGTEPFNRKTHVFASVLRRAKMRCELCGKPGNQTSETDGLKPYYIQPLSRGGEHSIKNVVALCTHCWDAMGKDPETKAIKALKRKTRSKLYDSLEVVRKNVQRHRRPVTGRRR